MLIQRILLKLQRLVALSILALIISMSSTGLSFAASGSANYSITVEFVEVLPTPTPVTDNDATYHEAFIGTFNTQPAGWNDETDNNTFNAELAYSHEHSYASLTRPADGAGWGKVLTQTIQVNVDTYDRVKVTIAEVGPGAFWNVGIQEQEGSYVYQDLGTNSNQTGEFTFTFLDKFSGWSGIKNFSVQLTIVGGDGTYVNVDSVKVARAEAAWTDDFEGTFATQPTAWVDETDNNTYNAELAYAHQASYASLTRPADGAGWGKVLTEVITADVDVYNTVEVNVTEVGAGAAWKVGIQEEGGSWAYNDLNTDSTATGTYTFEFASVMSWTGSQTFRIQMVIVGADGTYVNLQSVRLIRTAHNGYTEYFDGTSGSQPTGWQDETDNATFDTEITYENSGSAAEVAVAGSGGWGKTLSPSFNIDVTTYGMLEIVIKSIDPSTYWTVAIQEDQGTYRNWALNTDSNQTGVFLFDYATATGLTGANQIRVQVNVVGGDGSKVVVDQIRLYDGP